MRKIIPLLLIIITIGALSIYKADANDGFKLIAELNEEENYIELEWNIDDMSEPYSYQIQKKESGDVEFQTVPSKETVKVLNIYPEVDPIINYTTWGGTSRSLPKSASAEMWMEEPNDEHEKGYGMGLIDVDPVAMGDFNEDPESYLKNEDGWMYDAIYFGGWDSNGRIDIEKESIPYVESFIESGRGILFGHDTLDGQGNKNFNLAELRSYVNIRLGEFEFDKQDVPQIGSTKIDVSKRGLLTNYPWRLNDRLEIPITHTGRQIALGDIWMKFFDYENSTRPNDKGPEISDPITGEGTNNFYLTTWNNAAMIQTGHSNGEATPDEQKILANTMFYLSQITTDTEWKERSGIDVEAPDKVSDYEVDGANLTVAPPRDNGTEYIYQVIATGENSGNKVYSNEVLVSIESGLKGYSYTIDKNKDTNPDGKMNSESGKISLDDEVYKDHYLHIQSIDGEGNRSETSHIKLDKVGDRNPPSVKLTNTPNDWTNGNVTINVDAKDDESGISEVLMESENVIENGDFSERLTNWISPNQSINESWGIKDGVAHMSPRGPQMKSQMGYPNPIKGGLRDYFLIKVQAKGKANLNVRFSINVGSGDKLKYAQVQNIDTDKYEEFEYVIQYNENLNNELRLELTDSEGSYKNPGENDEIFIKSIEMYEMAAIDENKVNVHENGIYNVIATDNSGNFTKESTSITNIDKSSPTIDITQDVNDVTHENVVLTINADDSLSGIKSIMYIGENMVRDGSFQKGEEHWVAGGAGGEIRVEKGSAFLDDNTVIQNKMRQTDAFVGSEIGAKYYAKVTARGEGVINARYAFSGPGSADTRYKENLISDKDYHVYTFPIVRQEYSNDSFHIERIGYDGWIQVSDVELYAQKELNDNNTLEVTQNGTYTFVAEDNAGNITTKSHEVTNIDKYTKLHKPTISSFPNVSISDKTQSVYANVEIMIEDWRDSPQWKLIAKATELTNGNHVIPMKLNGEDLSNSIVVTERSGVRGVYEENINNLEIQIPPTAQVGKYESKITWELIMAP